MHPTRHLGCILQGSHTGRIPHAPPPQLATHKDRIVAAVESLAPAAPRAPAEPLGPGAASGAGRGSVGEGAGRRLGLGSCLDALVGALEEDLQCRCLQ